MGGINSDTKLMLHCNGSDGSTTFTDQSPSEHGNASVVGSAQVDTGLTDPWGGNDGVLECQGSSDYLYFSDSDDWRWMESLLDNWTWGFWLRIGEDRTEDVIFSQAVDAKNRWMIYLDSNRKLRLYGIYNNSEVITMYAADAYPISEWHHIALVKKANVYAFYLDEDQITYQTTASVMSNLNEALRIGSYKPTSALDFKGNLDEIILSNSNLFDADPNSDVDDTIVVPTEEYTEDPVVVSRNQAIIIV